MNIEQHRLLLAQVIMKTTHHLKLNIFALLYKIWDISEISSVINEELMDINEKLN